MTVEVALLGLVVLLLLAVLAVLLTRRPPADPMLPLLQAGQERQATALATMKESLAGDIARQKTELSLELSGFTAEQTRALSAAMLKQTESLGATEKALLERLSAGAALAQEASAEQTKAVSAAMFKQAESLAATEKALLERLAAGAALAQEASAEQTRAVSAAMLKQAETLAATEKALLERLAAGTALTQEASAEQTKAVGAAMLKQAESLATMQASLLERLTADAKSTQEAMSAETARSRDVLDKKLTEMRETSEKRLAEIQKSVNEQLAGAVEKQMNESFQRVIDQFAAIQQMMGNVQSVATQVGDLKRLFGNIKTRGGWGETQLKAMLDDFLPPGSYETNVKLREDSNDIVEFAILMPGGETRARLPLDAKFPSEDYERLMAAHEAGDLQAEAQARRAIEMRVRGEGAKIAQKYICPPHSTEYAILFLPTEGLYAEVARIPGLIDDLARGPRVFIAGPSLLPAMLKTIQLGYVSFALSKNAENVRGLLAATKAEMSKMDGVLERLGKQVGTVSNTIGDARVRTKAIARKLRSVEALEEGQSAGAVLGLEDGAMEDEEA